MSRARDFADLAGAADAGTVTGANLIINGDMAVAQRGTSATGKTSSGYYTCDRFRLSTNAEQTETHEQSTDAPDGFSNSYKVTVTTDDSSLVASDYASIAQIIEAQNLQHLQYGTGVAKQLTVSFWVKASATGTYTVGFYNYDSASYISNSYTIDSASTWEYKTLTFDGDVSGSINNDNEAGLEVYFLYSAGSSYTGGTANTWGTSANFAVGHTANLVTTINSTFQITGVKLEVGSTATPFQHESYAENLRKCQRYYQISADQSGGLVAMYAGRAGGGGANIQFAVPLAVPLRASPINLVDDPLLYAYSGGARLGSSSSATVIQGWHKHASYINLYSSTFSATDDRIYNIGGMGTGDTIILDSEL